MLTIRNVHKSYGKVEALKGVTIAIKDKSIYGIVGSSSSGKTSILKMCVGLLRPDSGTIEINGVNIMKKVNELHEIVGYMPEGFALYNDMTVEQFLFYLLDVSGYEREMAKMECRRLLKLVGLKGKEQVIIDSMTRGMKQRLSLARCLLYQPNYLILDQPFKGLDPFCKNELKDILKKLNKEGKTILIAADTLDELDGLCSKVSVIESGKIVMDGSIKEILNRIHDSSKLIIETVEGKDTAVEILKKNNNVQRIAVEKKSISISFTGNRYMEAMLLRELVQNNVLIASFSREKKDLDEILTKITKSKDGG